MGSRSLKFCAKENAVLAALVLTATPKELIGFRQARVGSPKLSPVLLT